MLRWMRDKTRNDMIRIKYYRECRGNTYSRENMVKNRFMRFQHVERKSVDFVIRRVYKMDISQITR